MPNLPITQMPDEGNQAIANRQSKMFYSSHQSIFLQRSNLTRAFPGNNAAANRNWQPALSSRASMSPDRPQSASSRPQSRFKTSGKEGQLSCNDFLAIFIPEGGAKVWRQSAAGNSVATSCLCWHQLCSGALDSDSSYQTNYEK